VVSLQWLSECVRTGRLQPPEGFEPPVRRGCHDYSNARFEISCDICVGWSSTRSPTSTHWLVSNWTCFALSFNASHATDAGTKRKHTEAEDAEAQELAGTRVRHVAVSGRV
jgi:hypothetical protein